MAERLARRRVGQVDLDERSLDAQQGVAQGDAGVGQAAGVHDREVEVALVEAVDEEPSWFDWKKATPKPELAARAPDPGVDLVERLVAVDLRLARPGQVQVRPLQDERPGSCRAPRREQLAGHLGGQSRAARPHGPRHPTRVGSTQRSRPAACFLSAASGRARSRASRGAASSQGRARRGRRAIRRPRSGGVTPTALADRARGAQPVGHSLAVEQVAIAGRGLHGMPDRVSEVERDPAAIGAPFALVSRDDLDLRPAGSLDELRDATLLEGVRITTGDRLAICLEQREQPLVAEDEPPSSPPRRGRPAARSGSVESSATSMTTAAG